METSSDDVRRPLVALKAKEGELKAISHADDEAARRVVHMVELLDSTGRDGGRITPLLHQAASHLASQGHPLWIDPRWLTSDSPLRRFPGGPYAYLNHIEQAVEDGLGLFVSDQPIVVPVVGEASSERDLRQVSNLREHKDRDVGLRVSRLSSSRADLEELADRTIRFSGVAPSRIHVIVDVMYVDIPTNRLIEDAGRVAVDLAEIFRPGSITLLTGSIPEQRQGYQTLIRPRSEPELWQSLRRSGLVGLRYGDYGVVHPTPKVSAGQARNPHPYLNYTVPGQTITLRRPVHRTNGVMDDGALAVAFRDIADELTDRREFAGGDFSWGDRSMIECRTGGGRKAGSVSTWIAMATSHHISHLARDVDGLAA
jgi:hypothetical protein